MTMVCHEALRSPARWFSLPLVIALSLSAGCKRDSRIREAARGSARDVQGASAPAPPADPRTATLALDDAHASQAAVGPRGGSVSVELPTGGRATLVIPRGALLATTMVRIIPVTSAVGLALSGGLSGAVQLEPEGLVLFRSATLTFDGTRPPSSGRARAVGWSGRGMNVHRRPHRRVDGKPTLLIAHFSGYAVGGESDDDRRSESNRSPAGGEARGLHGMPDVVNVPPGSGHGDPSGPPSDDEGRVAWEALRAWWQGSLRQVLVAAQGNDALLEGAIAEYLGWRSAVQEAALEAWFAEEQREALDLIANGLRNGIRIAYDLCKRSHVIEEVGTMVTWLGTAQMLGLSGRGGLSYAENRAKLEECLRMKLDSTLLIRYGGEGDDIRIEAELSVDQLQLRPSGQFAEGGIVLPPFEATGPLHYDRYEVDLGDEGCRAVDLQHSDGEVEISVELDVNLRAPSYADSLGGGSGGGRPAPPPIPYANIRMTPCAAARDGFAVQCEDQARVRMSTQLVTAATFAASQGDEAGAGGMSAMMTRQASGNLLFMVQYTMTPTMEGEPIHMELRHELTQSP